MGIQEEWARSTTRRMQKGGDLYRRPMSRAEMTADLDWAESHMAVAYRYGELEDGSIGWIRRANFKNEDWKHFDPSSKR